ncbi:hypothetical protein A0H81_04649 [Grifola frondosa]|uniref:Uncharacterized protein n=1 Tax=Grifola frondosa TaxID=5627 RepID=A0A1C7MF61_GRIFR|nr:hypothetical protein A0H81_04649 [Grifola frondosa]
MALLKAKVGTSEKEITQLSDEFEKVAVSTDELIESNNALHATQKDHMARISALEVAMDEIRELLQSGRCPGHNDEHSFRTTPGHTEGSDGTSERNQRQSELNALVRTCLHHLMGTTKNSDPPIPLRNGRFWTDDEDSPTRLLRPDWGAGPRIVRHGYVM